MKLIAILGPLKGLSINLQEKPTWIIGRDKDQCNFILEDSSVSRKHVKITKTPEGYLVKNLSNTNPAEVNDERVDEYLLKEDDKIKIGNTYFVYTAKQNEESEESMLNSEEENLFEKQLPESREIPIEKPLESFEDETIFQENEDEYPSPLITEAAFILKVISGPNVGSEYGMEKSKIYIIGKDPNVSEIIFTDLSVSKQNTKIIIDDDKNIFVEDLKSKNGTYVNNNKIKEKTQITSKDLITIGTTTFLIVEKEAAQETIYTPAPNFEFEEKKEESKLKEKEKKLEEATTWKKQIIPTRHLIFAGSFVVIFFVVFMSFFALFKANSVHVAKKEPVDDIKKIIEKYQDVQFSFNSSSANLFLVGHLSTTIDKQQLLYDLDQLNFISKIEDNIIIDEFVWKNFNDTLNSQADYRSVSVRSYEPGKFILEGYVKTPNDFQNLTEYVNLNFPYLDRLENQVVIDQILQVQIASKLQEKNFNSLSFEIISGELVLAGPYNRDNKDDFQQLLADLKKTPGIHVIKNLALPTSENSARIDLSQKYKISGIAKYDDKNFSIVANGKIVTIGDSLDGLIVTSITPDAILLEKEDIKYKINYSP
ncbi:MAG: type III secretion system inner membrane ring subunit SctD [Parachlamydiales bacterium]|jgi:type III secretion system YscD/HrpQ family protein